MAAAALASTPHQTSPLRFADAFWDRSDRGVDVIVQKLQNSKQTGEEIKKLYEIRSQIEEDYGDRLLKLSQLIVGQTEEGTLSESLSLIPSALETTARAHMDLAQQLKHHLEEPLDDFLQEQRNRRKQYQQNIEKVRKLKNMHYTNATKAKEFYTAECTKVAGMEKYLRHCGPDMTREELHQTREEIEEGKKMMFTAEQEFKHAINTYNSAANDWVALWRTSCDTFQDMETQRIDYVHASLRSFATMMSGVCLVDDQCCERIRTTVDMTNSQQDIEEFITRYGTGGNVPELIKFEAFVGMDLRASPAPSDKQEPEQLKQKEIPETFEVHADDDAATDEAPQVVGVEETPKADSDVVEALEIGHVPKVEVTSTKSNELPAKSESVKDIESESDSDSDSDSDDEEVEVLESMTLHRNVENTNGEPKQKDEVIAPATTAFAIPDGDAVISAIQEVEEYLRIEQTHDESTKKEFSKDERVSATPEEPSALPTPPLPVLVAVAVTLPEKDRPAPPASATAAMPSDTDNKEPVMEHDPPVFNPEFTPTAATAREEDVDPRSMDDAIVIPTTTSSDPEPVALPPVRIEMTAPALNKTHEDIVPVVSAYPAPVPPPKETPASEPITKSLPSAPAVVSDTTSTSSVDHVAPEVRPRSPSPVIGIELSDRPPNPDDENNSDDDDEFVKAYPPPPPKAEKWVISSIRRPQQLPVRVQNARMSMSTMSTPSLPTAVDLDHGNFRAPSTSTGHKFSRPNAPFKIDIPNKITSSSAVNSIHTHPVAVAPVHNQQEQQDHVYTAPQTAAQQVIAVGRALAHQTSAWQSPVTSTPNRRFSSFDPKRYQDYHQPLQPMDEHYPLYEEEDESAARKSLDSRLDSTTNSNINPNSSQTKKSHHLSSFVKGVLKPDHQVPKQQQQQQPGETWNAEKPTKEKTKDKRFSMNIFAAKREKLRNKGQSHLEPVDDEPVIPIFEDMEMYNGSRSTPLLRPSSTIIGPGPAFTHSSQFRSHHNLYQQSLQQKQQQSSQQQHQPQVQHVQDQLEDGTPVIEYARAIWTYEAKISTELSFMSGDGLAVINKQIDGWWLAELMDPQQRRRGLVPGNYMESVMA